MDYCMNVYYIIMLWSPNMSKLFQEVIVIVKASPGRYFAPVIGAIAAVRAEWSRAKHQA
jgi:hypothetical protein